MVTFDDFSVPLLFAKFLQPAKINGEIKFEENKCDEINEQRLNYITDETVSLWLQKYK